MDATTTRASTVIRSMPTSDTRTHASMTIPLSRTRSRTSMRLDPPAARSTGIVGSWLAAFAGSLSGQRVAAAGFGLHLREALLERGQLGAQLLALELRRAAGRA